jgi:hypothetical protein
MPAPSSDLFPLHFSLSTSKVYRSWYKSVTSKTYNNEYRMDLRWFVWHLESCSESGNHCSDARRPV